jgi:putative salt-induced outer membrane protein YdiY
VGTAGLSYLLKITPVADLVDDFLYLDDFKNSTDWRLKNSAGIVAHLNTTLSLKVSYDVRYRHLPVSGYLTTDTATIAALIVKL